MRKVLRTDWRDGSGWRVLSGFFFKWFAQGIGFTLDSFGYRLRVSWHYDLLRDLMVHIRQELHHRWYYYSIKDNRAKNPPWNRVEIRAIPFIAHIGPAYSGYLATGGEN